MTQSISLKRLERMRAMLSGYVDHGEMQRVDLSSSPGSADGVGGLGTAGHSDPQQNLAGILLTQRMFESPVPPHVMTDFWTLVYQEIQQ